MSNENKTIHEFELNLICDFFSNICLLYTSDAAEALK